MQWATLILKYFINPDEVSTDEHVITAELSLFRLTAAAATNRNRNIKTIWMQTRNSFHDYNYDHRYYYRKLFYKLKYTCKQSEMI